MYEDLHKAVSALAAVCDGALARDFVGFNGQDAKFGRRVAAMPVSEWNAELAAEVSRMLPTYRNQLMDHDIDLGTIKLAPISESHDVYSARDIARQAEYKRKNAPYVKITGNVVKVFNSFSIKNELKRNDFEFTYAGKSWDSELNGKAASTILGLDISLTAAQEQEMQALAANYTPPEQTAQEAHIQVMDGHIIIKEEFFGQIPLHVTRAIPGRRWDGPNKINHVSTSVYLYKLAEEYKLTISGEARALIEKGRADEEVKAAAIEATIADSKAHDTNVDVAIMDDLRPYQRAGVAYMITRRNEDTPFIGCLNADDMGLGKTRQAISALETKEAYPALVVCPSNLKFVWEREIKALIPHRTVHVYGSKNTGQRLMKADILIMSYNIVASYIPYLPKLRALVCDESHYIKNEKADRTKAILELTGNLTIEEQDAYGNKTKRRSECMLADNALVMELTGTPVLNRPIELVQQLVVLGVLNPRTKGEGSVSWFKYRYCKPEAKNGNAKWMSFNGATNTEELHIWLRQTCMVQRTKTDVLRELPPKTRSAQFIALTSSAMSTYVRMAREGAEKAAKTKAEAIVYLNALRGAVGTAKIEQSLEWANDFLESGNSLIVFAIHKNVQTAMINGLRAAGHNVTHILGGQDSKSIDEHKQRFQAKESNVIVVSFMAGAEGHTLTAASDVLFTEQYWNAEKQNQAEDRAHRIGQDNAVTAWYMVGMETIDEDMYELVEAKRKVTQVVNRGIKVEDEEENIFNQLLERTLDRYGR
jgi:SNF2 family DNA or RNA helicase